MQARMQNQNIGGYKIFKFKENAKFYFLSKPDRALQNRTHGKPRREMYSFSLIFWTLLDYLISRLRRDKSNQNVLEWREMFSLRKQPTFSDATTGFPAKWRLRNECRNSVLMTRHYPDLGSDTSSVWYFSARFSDIISRGNQWWRRGMSAVSQAWGRCAKFLYSQVPCLLRPSSFLSDHLRVSRSPFLNRRFLQ